MTSDSLPPLLVGRAFLVRDALDLVPYSRLRRRGVALIARGLRVECRRSDGVAPDDLVPVLGRHQHFSHLTAASLWGMPVPPTSEIHTTTVGKGTVTRRPGFVGHRVSGTRARVTLLRGIPVSDRVQTWAECSTMLTLEQLVIGADFLVGKKCNHEIDELAEVVAGRRGLRGTRLLREALSLVAVGSESPRETGLRLQLVREGFRLPLLNCEIHDEQDRFVARPDVIFGRERVVVEYDGDHHRTDRNTYRDDKRRREALSDAGWHALYLSDDDLTGEHWAALVGRLRRALERGEAVARTRVSSGPGLN